MENVVNLLGLLIVLAFLVESTVEYVLGRLESAKPYMDYVALAVGVLLAINYQVDVLKIFFAVSTGLPLVGYVLTGCIIGRGANYTHDVWSKFLKQD